MKIGILDDYLHVSLKLADWSGLMARTDIVVLDRPLSLEEAAQTLKDFEILCTLRERQPFPRVLLENLPRLRHLCVTGKRYDTVDVAVAAELGIQVSNTPIAGTGAGAVTELTWGLMLALTRHIAAEDRLMREGGWQHFVGSSLRGKQLGIVGLGGIGTDVARIGLAFGMDVTAWSPNLTPERAHAAGVRAVGKAELFRTSDLITLHLALSETTRGVVGAQEIAAMKPTAGLVNTARAGLLDEDALIAALVERRIGGAALDVYSIEPLPTDHHLRMLPNTVLTPHLGYCTGEMLAAYYGYAVENITAFLDGAPIRIVLPPPIASGRNVHLS